jgi:xeroderma pigmentosum group C-complementing protein
VPAVFQEMLREEQATQATTTDEDERPLKKRKTAQSQRTSSPALNSSPAKPAPEQVRKPPPTPRAKVPLQLHTSSPARTQSHDVQGTETRDAAPANERIRQTVIDSDESDGSDEEWEDALADGDDTDGQEEVDLVTPQVADISITIGAKKHEDTMTKRRVHRRAITSVDKKKRLDIHKMHVLCLLYHVYRRNSWCNDLRVQTVLRKLVPPKTLLNLVPNPDLTQYSASKRFVDGMNELKTLWSKRFKLTAQGMSKPKWAEADADVRPFSDFDELDDPMDKDDFRRTAHTLQGSQDVGTQLFCALLRGIGIEARLICSLQPLPFASSAQPTTPQKAGTQKNTIVLDPYNRQDGASSKATTPSRHKKLSRLERVMGERHAVLNKTGVAPQKQKAYHTPYPVYWVEVLNPAYQKWVAIDTHSTFTVNAPEKLEPPLNHAQNSLSYVVAFEEDYTAKDVTRRYAKAYNAKTRKLRVECMPHGAEWWRRTTKYFERAIPLDRDQVEDAALARKEAAEGVPKNVQDFKDHPVYVLERHLKHNEVLHPKEPTGKINVGTGMNPKLEPIYRRKNVHIVRSADKWYRMGQDVKDGEQPLKHAKPKKGRHLSIGLDTDNMDDQADEIGAGLYAKFQTTLYIPPPVVRGRVPRNAYGNLDLYVPSMCPPGGTHVRHKLASKAARLIGIDYADAVTGFSFKGRHGTAVVQGVVVASEYADAVQEVIDAMIYEAESVASAARSREALRMWRRFFLGLRIAERVNAMEIEGERGPGMEGVQGAIDREDKQMIEKEMAGGFFPDEADFAQPQPTRRGNEPPPQEDFGAGGGFFPDDEDADEDDNENTAAAPPPISLNREHSFESSILDSQPLRPRRRSSFADDYILEEDDDDEEGGGFIRDDGSDDAGPSKANDQTDVGVVGNDDAAEQGGGFVPEDEDTEYAADSANAQGPVVAAATDGDVAMHSEQEQSPPPIATPSDTGSLPLEDPEDEDADPDWLVDAT